MRIEDLNLKAEAFLRLAFSISVPPQVIGYIRGICHRQPTMKELDSWVETNASVLGSLKSKGIGWRSGYGELSGIYMHKGKTRIVKLRKDNNIDPKLDVISQSILRGVPPIPNLYLFDTEEPERQPVEFPKELRPYLYVAETFAEMWKTEIGGELYNEIIEFITTNKAKLDTLAKNFHSTPIMLGSGADGSVFSIGRDRILKLFGNGQAYEQAKAAMHRLWNKPEHAGTEALIYDVGELGNFHDHNTYYYIMERMTPVSHIQIGRPGMEETLGDLLEPILKTIQKRMISRRPYLMRIKQILNHPKAIGAIKQIAGRITEEVKNAQNPSLIKIQTGLGSKLSLDWLLKFVEEVLMKYMTGRTDLHLGNAGVSNGKIVYFDPSYGLDKEHKDMITTGLETDSKDWVSEHSDQDKTRRR